ncbi:hypothetical protein C1645_832338 [Glomus cerebriforme]|uniref:Uncharacterized protein n=1 Tax=Glomus cerebriforme TaxID=658196 RepID=A0A397SK84_9GLOM|nr:hypothetical protein C1645_832338 [Glomus cerebriforme]
MGQERTVKRKQKVFDDEELKQKEEKRLKLEEKAINLLTNLCVTAKNIPCPNDPSASFFNDIVSKFQAKGKPNGFTLYRLVVQAVILMCRGQKLDMNLISQCASQLWKGESKLKKRAYESCAAKLKVRNNQRTKIDAKTVKGFEQAINIIDFDIEENSIVGNGQRSFGGTILPPIDNNSSNSGKCTLPSINSVLGEHAPKYSKYLQMSGYKFL